MFGKEKNNFLFLPEKLFQRNQRGLTASGCLERQRAQVQMQTEENETG
jgi:hypothetical protein